MFRMGIMGSFDSSALEMLKDYTDESGRDLRLALIETYLKTTEADIQKLFQALGKDAETFHRLAHTLKSSSAAVGGQALSEICQRLEKSKDPSEQKTLLDEVPKEFQKLKVELEMYSQQSGL